MRNVHGSPIWYELLTPEPERAIAFYEAVVGWKFGDRPADGPDYRMIIAPNGENTGGMMPLWREMIDQGAKPTWLFYIGVDDVDVAVERITAAGGSVHLPARNIPAVGRLAMVADPQGNTFYVMRGAVDAPSTAWERTGMGKCNWNELATANPLDGQAFYADVFGWRYPDKMVMPDDLGDYTFIEIGGETIGAMMKINDQQPPGWLFYFRTNDIQAAKKAVENGGGTVMSGPMTVPGGDEVIVAGDPMGAVFGVVAPGRA